MFDLISTTPTDIHTAQEAYNAYWEIATSDNHYLASDRSPVYRFARENMLRALMHDHALTITQAVWLYEVGPLCEGPAWGSLTSMVEYGRREGFGKYEMAREVHNCITCTWTRSIDPEDVPLYDRSEVGPHHSVSCPLNGRN